MVDTSPVVEQEFGFDDFHFQYLLGRGRAKVSFDDRLGIAIKHADLWKSPELLAEFRNEVAIYNALSDLQCICIPQLKLFGHWQGSYCIGLTVHGSTPDRLHSSQQKKIIEIMDAIHSRGIIHGDIKKENILGDASGNPFVIDFGFATMNVVSEEARRIERDR